jgi:putative membrane protein
MRFLRVFLGALLLLILVVFAVANKGAVTVSVEPLPFVIELPLYLLVFAAILLGLLIGALAGWLAAWSSARRKAEAERQRQARQALQTTKPAAPDTGGQPSPPAPLV